VKAKNRNGTGGCYSHARTRQKGSRFSTRAWLATGGSNHRKNRSIDINISNIIYVIGAIR
jgi:hypothetical protein